MYLTKDELEIDELYECKARNFKFGFWDGTAFIYIRHKFINTFVDKEYHWDDGPPHGTVKPYKKIEQTHWKTLQLGIRTKKEIEDQNFAFLKTL